MATGPVDVLLETAITFDVPDRRVHCPMVVASIAGVTTKLILDTGSTDHVLTIDLASRAGLATTPAEPGTDHAGAPVASWSVGDVAMAIEDVDLDLHDVVAIDGPAPFAAWGIGGFLSPHNLHPSASVVIDLSADRLSLVAGQTDDVAGWLERRHRHLRALRLPREGGETVEVRASIAPFGPVTTMLNTGSGGTEFSAAAVPGLVGTAAADPGLGLSGASVDGHEVAGRSVVVAERVFPVATLLVRESMPPPPGQIGMDVLAGTVLAISPDVSEPVLWLVPRTAPAPS